MKWLRDLATRVDFKLADFMKSRFDANEAVNVDDAVKAVNKVLSNIAREPHGQQPLLLGVCDFNIGGALYVTSLESLTALMARLTALCPELAAILVIMPDKPKDGSKRGLCNDEGAIEKELWNMKLFCDRRCSAQGCV